MAGRKQTITLGIAAAVAILGVAYLGDLHGRIWPVYQ
jgi:hypothetical protein